MNVKDCQRGDRWGYEEGGDGSHEAAAGRIRGLHYLSQEVGNQRWSPTLVQNSEERLLASYWLLFFL